VSRALQMALDRLQPSQLYISADKLRYVLESPEPLEPVPIVRLGAHLIMTDGHTRAFAAWTRGQSEVPVVWDEDDMDWEAYEVCVQWCAQEGIHTVADLRDRVVDAETYQAKWLDRCAAMHRSLEARRAHLATQGTH
jgi:hypothetical protein